MQKTLTLLIGILFLLFPNQSEAQQVLNVGIPVISLAAVTTTGDGTTFALPSLALQCTWQSTFGTAPASLTLQLKTSNDNVTFSTIDTSTSTTSESRTISTSARFILARLNALSGSSTVTVSINCFGIGNSGFGLSPTDDSLIVGNGTAWQVKTLTSCSAVSSALTYNTATNAFGCNTISGGGGGGTPASPTGSVQFNDSGSFGGFGSWDGSTLNLPDGASLSVLGPFAFGDGSFFNPHHSAGTIVFTELAAANFYTGLFAEWDITPATNNLYVTGFYADPVIHGDQTGTSFDSIFWYAPDIQSTGVIDTARGLVLQSNTYATSIVLSTHLSIVPWKGSGAITDWRGVAIDTPGGDGTATTWVAYYASDQTSSGIVNNYYSWFDSRGVRRIKEDTSFDSVGQAIEALYNPQFTKYTSGASNHERMILGQWNGNVGEIGTEKGGTGTLRNLRLIGGGLEFGSTLVAPASSGTRYLCISTAGVVTSSASACSGT